MPVFYVAVCLHAPNKSDTDVKWESALMGNLHNNKHNGAVRQSWILLSVQYKRDFGKSCGMLRISSCLEVFQSILLMISPLSLCDFTTGVWFRPMGIGSTTSAY